MVKLQHIATAYNTPAALFMSEKVFLWQQHKQCSFGGLNLYNNCKTEVTAANVNNAAFSTLKITDEMSHRPRFMMAVDMKLNPKIPFNNS